MSPLLLIRIKHLTLALSVVALGGLMQGCLGALWLGAVGSDLARSSDVEFQPFQNSWVAPSATWHEGGSMTSVAVTPVVENTAMAARLTAILQQATSLHVISPSEVTTRLQLQEMTEEAGSVRDQDEIKAAQRITAALGVDCVLFVREVEGPSQESFWGWKQRYSNRLYLELVNAEGTLLWRDELPFIVVKGDKALEEEWVRQALGVHLVAQLNKIGLAMLGLPLKQDSS
ncbi:MAG: hypothetical protein ACREI2_11110 [Nitrospiraceae bacterium]